MPSLTMSAAPSGRASGRYGGVVSSSSRKSANRYFSEETMPSSDTRDFRFAIDFPATSGVLRRRQCHLLRQPPLQRIEILEQARGGELQEVEAEGRVLHVELLDLVVAHAQDHASLDAFQRLRAPFGGRQHAKLTDDGADRQLDAGLDQAEA